MKLKIQNTLTQINNIFWEVIGGTLRIRNSNNDNFEIITSTVTGDNIQAPSVNIAITQAQVNRIKSTTINLPSFNGYPKILNNTLVVTDTFEVQYRTNPKNDTANSVYGNQWGIDETPETPVNMATTTVTNSPSDLLFLGPTTAYGSIRTNFGYITDTNETGSDLTNKVLFGPTYPIQNSGINLGAAISDTEHTINYDKPIIHYTSGFLANNASIVVRHGEDPSGMRRVPVATIGGNPNFFQQSGNLSQLGWGYTLSNRIHMGQTFIGDGQNFTDVTFTISGKKDNGQLDGYDTYIRLYKTDSNSHPTGSPLHSITISAASIVVGNNTFDFVTGRAEIGTEYAVMFEFQDGGVAENYFNLGYIGSGVTYAPGKLIYHQADSVGGVQAFENIGLNIILNSQQSIPDKIATKKGVDGTNGAIDITYGDENGNNYATRTTFTNVSGITQYFYCSVQIL